MMFGLCKACVELRVVIAELRRQNEYLQGLVDRLMVQTWPKPDATPEEPVKTELPEGIAERITFGEG